MSKLDTKMINKNLKGVFNRHDSAAKINIDPEFVLRIFDSSKNRYFYAHEKNTLPRKVPYDV